MKTRHRIEREQTRRLEIDMRTSAIQAQMHQYHQQQQGGSMALNLKMGKSIRCQAKAAATAVYRRCFSYINATFPIARQT